jgi:hypothetical protein
LHEGRLRADGDADQSLRWFGDHDRAIHSHDAHEAPAGATGYSRTEAAPGAAPQRDVTTEAATPVAAAVGNVAAEATMAREPTPAASEPLVVDAATLLRAMGGRGGWTADALIEATGLGAARVAAALAVLQLERRAESDGLGRFSPGAHDVPIGASPVAYAA